MFEQIINAWNTPLLWLTLPMLNHHLEHMGMGFAVVLVVMPFLLRKQNASGDSAYFVLEVGDAWLVSAIVSASVFLTIELVSAIALGESWHSSCFDLIQYSFHWPAYFVLERKPWLAWGSAAALLVMYFVFLLT